MCGCVCGCVGCSATGSMRHALRMCNAASVLIIRHVCAVKPNNEPAPKGKQSSAKSACRQPPATPTLSNTKSNGPLIMQRLPKAILIREPQSICHLWMVKIAHHSFRMRFVSPHHPTPLSRDTPPQYIMQISARTICCLCRGSR